MYWIHFWGLEIHCLGPQSYQKIQPQKYTHTYKTVKMFWNTPEGFQKAWKNFKTEKAKLFCCLLNMHNLWYVYRTSQTIFFRFPDINLPQTISFWWFPLTTPLRWPSHQKSTTRTFPTLVKFILWWGKLSQGQLSCWRLPKSHWHFPEWELSWWDFSKGKGEGV